MESLHFGWAHHSDLQLDLEVLKAQKKSDYLRIEVHVIEGIQTPQQDLDFPGHSLIEVHVIEGIQTPQQDLGFPDHSLGAESSPLEKQA